MGCSLKSSFLRDAWQLCFGVLRGFDTNGMAWRCSSKSLWQTRRETVVPMWRSHRGIEGVANLGIFGWIIHFGSAFFLLASRAFCKAFLGRFEEAVLKRFLDGIQKVDG